MVLMFSDIYSVLMITFGDFQSACLLLVIGEMWSINLPARLFLLPFLLELNEHHSNRFAMEFPYHPEPLCTWVMLV